MERTRGFTLIEIIIIIVILGSLAMIIIGSSSRQVSYYSLQKTASGVISLLEKAQSRAINSYNDTQHSVRLENTRAVLFEGTSYSEGAASNEILPYDSGVSLSATNLNGGVDTVNFEKVVGTTADHGSMTFVITGATTSSSTVYISEAGVIYTQ